MAVELLKQGCLDAAASTAFSLMTLLCDTNDWRSAQLTRAVWGKGRLKAADYCGPWVSGCFAYTCTHSYKGEHCIFSLAIMNRALHTSVLFC